MNGEMHHICRLLLQAKRAMRDGTPMEFDVQPYELTLGFCSVPSFFLLPPHIAKTAQKWYAHCRHRGLRDIKCYFPTRLQDHHLLAFSGVGRGSLICYYQSGEVSRFTPEWKFDQSRQGWHIRYCEYSVSQSDLPLLELPEKDPTEAFVQVLNDIRDFATEIFLPHFADYFGEALSCFEDPSNNEAESLLPLVSEKYRGMFAAASLATNVFGGMGSWNDDGDGAARQAHLSEQYRKLSEELLLQHRRALMYAVNHC
ncbi:MAG: hypothetical protein IJW97_05760 [Clostridia bacterium]|nr:hypothetical protein [Clostridia bacterium]